MKTSKDIVKMMDGIFTYNSIITKTFEPTEALKELVKNLVPSFPESELKSLKKIQSFLQQQFVNRNRNGREDVWMKGDENFSPNSKTVKCWFKKFTKTRYLKDNNQPSQDVALILGSSIASVCKRTSFLLQEAAKNNITFNKIAVLGGNREITKVEYDYINEFRFDFKDNVKTEYDFMKLIMENPSNVLRMLSSSGIDPLEVFTKQPYQSNETLRNEANVSIEDCFKVYGATPNFVYINSISPSNLPSTYDTICDYIKDGSFSEEERIILASCQPHCDYQLLESLRAFVKVERFPKSLTCIGPRITNVPAQYLASELLKTLNAILEILDRIGVKVR